MADTPTPTLHDRLVAMLTAGERLRRTAPVDDDFPEVMHQFDGAMRVAREALDAAGGVAPFDLVAHLHRQRAFSLKTFGPGARTAGVLDHIRKELAEVEADPADVAEWVDLVILALDGAWRAGHEPRAIVDALVAKQTRNEGRTWPDWRTADPSKAIEHDRSGEDDGLPVAEHAAVLASIPKPEAPRDAILARVEGGTLREAPPGLSELHDQVAAVMNAWRGQNGGIFAVNGCALEVARLVLTGQAGSLAPDASGEQVAAHYNVEDAKRRHQEAEVERVEREAELSCLRGTVERLRREQDEIALAAGMYGGDLDDRRVEAAAIVDRVRQLARSRSRNEGQATEALRMLWLVVRVAGAPNGVTIPLREVMAVDWSRCALRREKVLGTGDIHLEAVDTERGQGIPPSAAAHANAGMAAVADALGLDDDADLATVLQGIDSLKARAARVIDRNLEVTITTALGCDDTAAAIVQAIQALKHQAGQGGPSVYQRMHQQLLDMLGAGDHQGAAARTGELAGLELLLTTGGAGRGVTAIAQERRRQIEGERFDPTADQQYRQGELARAAACYVRLEAMRSVAAAVPGTAVDDRVPPEWPWARCWWKPKDRRSNLVRAGALIAAELDRMDREGAANA